MSQIQTAPRQREFRFERADFDFIAGLVRQRTGIVLAANKQDMVYGRLTRRLRALGMASFTDYCALVSSPAGQDELTAFTNALTTNLTAFFRESHHYEHLRDEVLPRLAAQGGRENRRLRIWSAGSSSGEEAYSAAMVLLSTLPEAERWDARILGTDIDSSMVTHATAGLYDAERAARIPDALRRRFIESVPGQPNKVRMAGALRRLVTFKRLNLLGRWPMGGPFDVIFCRNVAIYFDKPTQERLYTRLGDLLAPGGTLYIGHSEHLGAAAGRFVSHGRTTYSKA
ncbi:CheR family methyltransferase [Novispirillum sp. DQ9]|uniref:CheR family methyltransferase n=1 Tax=Novispirillum sp. DQ9 TaxID=3398612 RepID=UPI003C7E61D0